MGRKKENKRFYPTEEDPRYGQAFQIVEVQFQDIDRDFTGWIGNTPEVKFTEKELISVGKDWSEWRKVKNRISDALCGTFNGLKLTNTPLKDVVAIKAHYLGDPRGVYQIL